LVEAVGSKGDVQIDPHDIKEQHLLSLGQKLDLNVFQAGAEIYVNEEILIQI
jgi:hypothetical protein